MTPGALEISVALLWLVVLVLAACCMRAIRRGFADGRLTRADWRDPRLIGVVLSGAMALSGFVLGASICSSNTMIPGHYHASIGAVTMAAASPSMQAFTAISMASVTAAALAELGLPGTALTGEPVAISAS